MEQLSTSLQERLGRLRVKSKSFPGLRLIELYLASNRADTYCEYYQGFRLLHDWLSPLDWTDVIPITPKEGLGTYDIQELAKICHVSQAVIYGAILEIHYGRELTQCIADRSKDKATFL